MATEQLFNQTIIEEYVLAEEPYYLPLADEIEIFEAALSPARTCSAQRSNRYRQDTFRRAHVMASGRRTYRCKTRRQG